MTMCYQFKQASRQFLIQKSKGHSFPFIEAIFAFNKQLFGEMRNYYYGATIQPFSRIFLQMGAYLKLYIDYVTNYNSALSLFSQLLKQKNHPFNGFLKKCEPTIPYPKETLQSYLIMPVQRVPRYTLLMKDLVKNTESNHSDYNQLIEAFQLITKVAEAINEKKRESENREKCKKIGRFLTSHNKDFTLVAAHRRFLREGSLRRLSARSLEKEKEKEELKEKMNPDFHYFFLFSDCLLFVKTSNKWLSKRPTLNSQLISEMTEEEENEIEFTFKLKGFLLFDIKSQCTPVPDWLFASENVKNTFVVDGMVDGKRMAWTLSAPSPAEEEKWIKDINDIMKREQLNSIHKGVYEAYQALQTMKWIKEIENKRASLASGCRPLGLAQHSCCYWDKRMIVFGGSDGDKIQRKLFLFNTESKQWIVSIKDGGEIPTKRCYHTMSVVGNRIFLVGGSSGRTYLNSVYVLRTDDWVWTRLTLKGYATTRAGHSSVVVGKKLVFFGGRKNTDQPIYFNDLLVLDTEDESWNQLKIGGKLIPKGRAWHTASFTGTQMLVFGGMGENEELYNDIMVLDLVKLQWVKPETQGDTPSPRYGHSACIVGGGTKLVIFGGMDHSRVFDDVFVLDLATMAWIKPPSVSGPPPAPRAFHSAISNDGNILFYGGTDGCEFYTHLFALSTGIKGGNTPPATNAVLEKLRSEAVVQLPARATSNKSRRSKGGNKKKEDKKERRKDNKERDKEKRPKDRKKAEDSNENQRKTMRHARSVSSDLSLPRSAILEANKRNETGEKDGEKDGTKTTSNFRLVSPNKSGSALYATCTTPKISRDNKPGKLTLPVGNTSPGLVMTSPSSSSQTYGTLVSPSSKQNGKTKSKNFLTLDNSSTPKKSDDHQHRCISPHRSTTSISSPSSNSNSTPNSNSNSFTASVTSSISALSSTLAAALSSSLSKAMSPPTSPRQVASTSPSPNVSSNGPRTPQSSPAPHRLPSGPSRSTVQTANNSNGKQEFSSQSTDNNPSLVTQ
eukprot:TRINITY_DN4167_c0_g1_i2.p1 TRINITY_DN4167_c0_g1~~TRINITY_DN4167_c0_g1_i2.p1  ORF type:complete len:1011 (+),score=257.81 TRINITY_DN4167_c0_g1_i2:378-3410(+)